MAAQQAFSQAEFSTSANVAPRSTTARDTWFSALSASSCAPIRHVQGEVGLLHNLLLQIRNPALRTDKLTSFADSTATLTKDILNSRPNALQQVIEEDRCIHSDHPPTSFATSPNRRKRVRTAAEQYLGFSAQSFAFDETINTRNSCHVQPLSDRPYFLSFPSNSTIDPTMTAPVSAPGTPPELTESQSSKSSSYASEFSPTDDFAGGNMNFEEINLDDENHKVASKSEGNEQETRNRPSARQVTSKRPALATLQTQAGLYSSSAKKSIHSAGLPSKRNFTSPVLSHPPPENGPRSHSQSPALHRARSTSRLGQFSQSATSLAVPGRRGSWQPARKTIYEIEAEYHESDDELPDDASLFNVPHSPLPGYPRTGPPSAASSACGSPECRSPTPRPVPIPLGHVNAVPDTPSKPRKSSRNLPRQRLTPRSSSSQLIQQSKSTSTSPRNDMRYGRTRSWNLVMADLDHEARLIAEKLDFYSEIQSKSESATTNPQRSSAPGAIPLPPIQRGTLDFMPTSKEKEAVLSRTRPSWLPPKDPREERRHLEEYKRMMKASLDADKRREAKVKDQSCTTDTTRGSLHRIWAYYAQPSTDLATIDSRVNDLCWRGIPPSLRGAVWQRRAGNPLGLSKDTFTAALERVKEVKSRPIELLDEREKTMQEWFADIERDAEMAFPEVSVFKRDGPQWQDLIHVCEAYASYRSDVGYSYGMQLVAALILIQLPVPAAAFILLADCLSKTTPMAFQTSHVARTSQTYTKVKSMLELKVPSLYNYLFSDYHSGGLGFTGEELFEPMFRTVFANGLDLDRLCRTWDVWIFEDDRYLLRAAVALLGGLQDQIFAIEGDIHLRRRNIQELLGWGPYGRDGLGYWKFDVNGEKGGDDFVAALQAVTRLNGTG